MYALPDVENHKTLLDDYLEIWVESFLRAKQQENLAKGSIVFYKTNLAVFTKFCNSQSVNQISRITPNLLRDFLLNLEDGHTSSYVHGFYRSLRAFLRWYEEEAEPEGWKNPIAKVKPPKMITEPIQGVTHDDFQRLLDACTIERDKTILHVLLDCGVRADELCSIKMEHLSLVDNSILILQGKGRKPRSVFFGMATRKQIRKYLRQRKHSPAFLFAGRSGDRLDYFGLREVLKRLNRKAGTKARLHDFRRSFTLNLLQRGVPEITIARLLGHTSTILIGRYAAQSSRDIQSLYKSPLDE